MNLEELYNQTYDKSLAKCVVVKLEDVKTDVEINARESIRPDVVKDYEELYTGETRDVMTTQAEAPNPIQPALLNADSGGFFILDGWHRIKAALNCGVDVIGATIYNVSRQYTEQEARLLSTTVNVSHGLRRSDADKRKAVKILLTDEPGRTDALIAKLAKVSNALVASVRKELIESGTLLKSQTAQERIDAAIEKAEKEGRKTTVRQLAKEAGVSPTTVQKRRSDSLLQKSKNKTVTDSEPLDDIDDSDDDSSDDATNENLNALSKKMQNRLRPEESTDQPDSADRPQNGSATARRRENEFRTEVDAIRQTLTAAESVEIVNNEERTIVGYTLPCFSRDPKQTLARIIACSSYGEIADIKNWLIQIQAAIRSYLD